MAERSERITVRFTKDEEDWVIEKANKSGVSKSRYIRNVTLGELPQAELPFASNQQELKLSDKITKGEFLDALYEQLPGATNNLNQIARRLNSGEGADQEMAENLEAIKQDFNKISDILLEVEG